MFCYNCGGTLPDSASYCPHCSTPVPAVVQDNAPTPMLAPPAASVFPVAVATGPYPPQSDDKAVLSLVLGVLALVSFSVLTGIPAIILGNASRERIRASGGRLTGDGLATAGVVMGWISVGLVGVALLIFLAILAFAIPGQR